MGVFAVEGFAQYKSYKDVLAAKHGLGSGSENMTASEIAQRAAWDKLHTYNQEDLYAALKSGKLTPAQLRDMVGTANPKGPRTASHLIDITDYSPSSSDYDAATGKYNYRYKAVIDEYGQAINPDTFEEDLRLTQGKFLKQCDSNDFNCIRMMSYATGNQAWRATRDGGDSASPYGGMFGADSGDSEPAPMPSNNAGFPTTAPAATPSNMVGTIPATLGGSNATGGASNMGRCIIDCIYKYGGIFTEANIMSCTTLCQNSK